MGRDDYRCDFWHNNLEKIFEKGLIWAVKKGGKMGGKSSSKSSSSTSQSTQSSIGDTSSLNIEFGSSTFNTGHLETTRLASTNPSNSQTPYMNSTTSQRADSSATGATATLPLLGGGGGAIGAGGDILDNIAGLASAGLGAYGSYQSAKNASSLNDSYYSSGNGLGGYNADTSGSGSILPLLAIGGAGLALIYFIT